jgi:hypothetical protein
MCLKNHCWKLPIGLPVFCNLAVSAKELFDLLAKIPEFFAARQYEGGSDTVQ